MPYFKFPKLPPFAIGLNRLVFFSLMIALISCKKQKPVQTWFYDRNEITVLNGRVKQILFPGEPEDKSFYKVCFDENGNMKYTITATELASQDKENKHPELYMDTTDYKTLYNASGEKIAMTDKRREDTTISKSIFDSKGNIVRFNSNSTDPFHENCVDFYKYNARGDLSELEKHFCKLRCPEVYRYSYDKTHKITGLKFYESCGEGQDFLIRSENFEYRVFDTHNNWIKRVVSSKVFRNQPSTYTETRKITYY